MTRKNIFEAVAHEIQTHEGFFVKSPLRPWGSRSWRNNSPGNLKTGNRLLYKGQIGWDWGGFAKFRTYEDGLNALLYDIELKFLGKSRTSLGPNSTIQQFFKVYAPIGDNNNPYRYAMAVVQGLNLKYGIKISVYDTLGKLLSMATDSMKILVALYKVKDRIRLDGILGSFVSYLKNAFENTKDISLETYEIPSSVNLNYISVDIRVGANYELTRKEIVDVSQLRDLLKDKVTDHKLVFLIDCDGRGLTSSSYEKIDGALVNQMNFVPFGDETVFLDDLIHESLHAFYTFLNQRGEVVKDDVHNFSSIFDQRLEARYTQVFKNLKNYWNLL